MEVELLEAQEFTMTASRAAERYEGEGASDEEGGKQALGLVLYEVLQAVHYYYLPRGL